MRYKKSMHDTESQNPTLREIIDAEKHGSREISFDSLLDVSQVQALLNLPSPNWLYQKSHLGTLPFPFVKVGHYLRFPADGIRKYIESRTRKGHAA